MEWNQVWAIIGANIGLALVTIGTTITLFLWARGEGNADRRQFQHALDEHMRELDENKKQWRSDLDDHKSEWRSAINEMKGEFTTLIKEIGCVNRDFHGRMVALEENSDDLRHTRKPVPKKRRKRRSTEEIEAAQSLQEGDS